MNKKPKLVYGIKGKLVSAACMLLVAVIMVVSSTYAWFTLSTAPEVTGISTAVGANGSLEMALVPKDNGEIKNATPGMTTDDINRTWGNLVTLEDGYGLDQIILYPSLLNMQADGKLNTSTMLNTPVYGADGRVSDISDNTILGTYLDGQFKPIDGNAYGVRAVGVASGMTTRQLTYRSAKSAAGVAASLALKTATDSLNVNGNALANIALKHGIGGGTDTYGEADVASLQKIVDDLLGTATKTGALQHIRNAYANYLLAEIASANHQTNTDITDELLTNLAATISTDETWETLKDNIPDGDNAFSVGIAKYEATLEKVEAAQTALNNLTGKTEGITWAEISAPLKELANVEAMEINGYAASTVRDNMSAIINSVAGKGLTVAIATGGGVYADIADQCGDYNAAIVIEEVEYNGLVLENMNAKMQTATEVTPTYLSATYSTVGGAPSAASGEEQPLSEFYGYVLDLAFRTNAVGSNLLLQTTPVDRIYSDNENADTMGSGSTMSFEAVDPNYTAAQMKDLMASLYVVFFAQDGTIYGIAKLDTGNAVETGGNKVTANLYLYNIVTTYTYEVEGDDASTTDVTETKYSVTVYENKGLYYSDADCTTATTIPSNVALMKVTSTETKIENQSDAIIKSLTQNATEKVSVLVYLDGTNVENGDVAAKAAQSMKGSLNLQFSSDAILSPMEYGDLHKPSEGSLEIKMGESGTVNVDGATTYESSATSVCTVDASGNITPVAAGNATITAKDATGKVLKTWKITVIQ